MLTSILLVPGLLGSFVILGSHKFDKMGVFSKYFEKKEGQVSTKISDKIENKTTLLTWMNLEGKGQAEIFSIFSRVYRKVEKYDIQFVFVGNETSKNWQNLFLEKYGNQIYPTKWYNITLDSLEYATQKSNLYKHIGVEQENKDISVIVDRHGRIRISKGKKDKEYNFYNLEQIPDIKRIKDDILMIESESRLAFKENTYINEEQTIKTKQ